MVKPLTMFFPPFISVLPMILSYLRVTNEATQKSININCTVMFLTFRLRKQVGEILWKTIQFIRHCNRNKTKAHKISGYKLNLNTHVPLNTRWSASI